MSCGCREAAAQNADHFRALKLLGSALYALGDFQAARHELQQALRLQPDYPDALCDLGCTYCALGQTPEAANSFSDALTANPHHLEVCPVSCRTMFSDSRRLPLAQDAQDLFAARFAKQHQPFTSQECQVETPDGISSATRNLHAQSVVVS